MLNCVVVNKGKTQNHRRQEAYVDLFASYNLAAMMHAVQGLKVGQDLTDLKLYSHKGDKRTTTDYGSIRGASFRSRVLVTWMSKKMMAGEVARLKPVIVINYYSARKRNVKKCVLTISKIAYDLFRARLAHHLRYQKHKHKHRCRLNKQIDTDGEVHSSVHIIFLFIMSFISSSYSSTNLAHPLRYHSHSIS